MSEFIQVKSLEEFLAHGEALSRSFSSHGRKPRGPSTCACDLRELLFVPLRTQGYCGVGRGTSVCEAAYLT